MAHESIRLIESFRLTVQNRHMTKSAITPFPLRLTPDLREKLDAASKRAGRSLQSEIAARLAYTFEKDLEDWIGGNARERADVGKYDSLADIIVSRLAERLDVQKVQIARSGKMVATLDPAFGRTTKGAADADPKPVRKSTRTPPSKPKPEETMATMPSVHRVKRTTPPKPKG
jgi:hypothetical protein